MRKLYHCPKRGLSFSMDFSTTTVLVAFSFVHEGDQFNKHKARLALNGKLDSALTTGKKGRNVLALGPLEGRNPIALFNHLKAQIRDNLVQTNRAQIYRAHQMAWWAYEDAMSGWIS